jgi:hypothetical protein
LATQMPCSSDTTLNRASFVDKQWSPNNGFQSLDFLLHTKFDYIKAAGNLEVYVVGVLGTSNFGLLSKGGKFVLFQKFPSDFDPRTDHILLSRAAQVVAIYNPDKSEMFVWNRAGKLMPPLKTPPGCIGFSVSNIDSQGTFFGTSDCPNLSVTGQVGLRVTSTQAQTIHEWLESEGVLNNLGPNAFVDSVSENGKTVLGETTYLLYGLEGNDGNTFKNETSNCLTKLCVFLAHVR